MRIVRMIFAAGVPLLMAMTGCTTTSAPDRPTLFGSGMPALNLISYDSCGPLLAAIRSAAKESVQVGGLPGQQVFAAAGEGPRDMAAGAPEQQKYSGTNTHELGTDEPDLVKTDGRRIVVVSGDRLRVIDAHSRRLTGALRLPGHSGQLLLHGERALVIGDQPAFAQPMNDIGAPAMPQALPPSLSVHLVDLTGVPTLIGTFDMEASFVDARLTDGIARLVVRSSPRLTFPLTRTDEKAQLKANKQVIDNAPVEAWLPGYRVDGTSGRVECGDVSRPETFSGASLITVLSFDLAASRLTDGDPVSVLADANTVYGTGTNLYLAHDQRWRGDQAQPGTELFQFDLTGRRPAYAAGGLVPGWLLNQYSLSEHDGVLRVATTTEDGRADRSAESAVYTLRRDRGSLSVLGRIDGLGKGERIYAVRFVGPVAYVVTFRQTDPLYTIDLNDPARPRLAGELKIPGYSAYLHPAGPGRLIGVGQHADDTGRVQGLQVSLFDVSWLDDPRRLAQHHARNTTSEAEYDPHAFLYWEPERLLVVPIARYDGGGLAQSTALLRITDSGISRIGEVNHGPGRQIRRSLVIGDTLWTVSDEQALATSLDGRQLRGAVELNRY